jgi:hypothetical protein
MKLTPTTAGTAVENGVVSVGLADFREAPGRSLVLSRMLQPSTQDIEVGEDTYDLSDENGWSVYAPFSNARLHGSVLEVELTEEAQSVLVLPAEMRIDLSALDATVEESVLQALARVAPELADSDSGE